MAEPPFRPETQTLPQSRLNEDVYQLQPPLFYQIINKVQAVGTPLKEHDIRINSGVKTGFNEAVIIDGVTKQRLIEEDPRSGEVIKPLLRGRDLERWYCEYPDLWLIFTRRGIDIDQYPAVKAHLQQYYKQLRPRNNGEKTGRAPGNYVWYEIQSSANYYEDFDNEKIVYSEIVLDGRFSVDFKGFYNESTSYFESIFIFNVTVFNLTLVVFHVPSSQEI